MIDDNSKKLGRVFMIVLIVIGIIIMLYLVHHTLSVNNYKYELPTTTTEIVDKDITSLSDTEKINYNTLINDESFLRGINNAIDYNNKDINVFESELTKFKYLYSKNDKVHLLMMKLILYQKVYLIQNYLKKILLSI